MSEQPTIDQFTDEQLEEMLHARQEKKRRELEQRREKYNEKREKLIDELCSAAVQHSELLGAFKKESFEQLAGFSVEMMEYGNLKPDGKGNFTLISADKRYKIMFRNQVKMGFTELAMVAEKNLREFLHSFIKKRNAEAYKLVSSLIERVNNDYDIKLIQRLYKMENEYTHPQWVEAIRLFKEAWQPQDTAGYATFYKLDDSGRYQLINLHFSSL